MFETFYPKKYGHSAFYAKIKPNCWIRVYKIEHLFSCVGAAHIFVLHISFRHLRKAKHLLCDDRNYICFDCDVDSGIEILSEWKRTGKADLFRALRGKLVV